MPTWDSASTPAGDPLKLAAASGSDPGPVASSPLAAPLPPLTADFLRHPNLNPATFQIGRSYEVWQFATAAVCSSERARKLGHLVRSEATVFDLVVANRTARLHLGPRVVARAPRSWWCSLVGVPAEDVTLPSLVSGRNAFEAASRGPSPFGVVFTVGEPDRDMRKKVQSSRGNRLWVARMKLHDCQPGTEMLFVTFVCAKPHDAAPAS